MPRVPAVVFSAPSITGGESSGAAGGSSTADGTPPTADNHCERNHKFYAKVSIDFGLLITTLVQMRVVVVRPTSHTLYQAQVLLVGRDLPRHRSPDVLSACLVEAHGRGAGYKTLTENPTS
ncbi:hypothetical protein pipiens_014790 [Culex pipiens pipiens]|uniref:Uncharacterized protein n=1 Tax=Culex pipiens pipiens TaxID=38569 RepID=A0ABD1CT45_CULPP